ncbi:MAG: dihydrodipicolinate synthase family protein [Verrucomicrobia bacterium]|nr:dihydrodipicolinate synthase family protein [Verrucomicrobiota bacterium]MBI3867619.1 dihydrodipicolinate synthase family protein [Verrucomicrobiota bacterium]
MSATAFHRLQQGVFPALWTPTDQNGRLLEPEFARFIDFGIRSGVSGFMVLGTTGEFPHLEVSERKRVVEAARSRAGGLPLMVNISDIRPRVVAELGRFCKDLGVDAISLLPPYYFTLSQEDLLEFFLRSAEAAGLPAFLYNFPERVGYRISLETAAAFADRAPMLGIKQSGAEFAYHQELVALGRQKHFVVFTGSDTALPEAMALGVVGTVSGLSNALADLVVKVYQGVSQGRGRAEIPEAAWLTEIEGKLSAMEFPFNVGAALAARGFDLGASKMLASVASLSRFERLKAEFQALYSKWNLL